MKPISTIILVAACLTALLRASWYYAAPAAGGGGFDKTSLVAWWNLDGDLTDDHASFDLTEQGSGLYYTNDVWSAASGALRTTAATASAYVADDSAFESDDFSIVMWVRGPVDTDSYAVTKQQSTTDGERSYLFLLDNNATGDRVVFTGVDDANATAATTTALSSFAFETWTHLAVVHDSGTRCVVYSNGSPIQTNAIVSAQIRDSSARFQVGSLSHTTEYDIEICRLSYWGRLLSAAEISTLYNSGSDLKYADL